MLSQTSQYALRAVLFLAESRGPRTAAEIAAQADIPPSYVSKALQVLVREHVLHSARGRRGGFRLAVAPAALLLSRIVEPFDTNVQRRHCIMGGKACSDRTACAAHHTWKPTAERIEHFFRHTSVAEVMAGRLIWVGELV